MRFPGPLLDARPVLSCYEGDKTVWVKCECRPTAELMIEARTLLYTKIIITIFMIIAQG